MSKAKIVYIYNRYRVVEFSPTVFHVQVRRWFKWKPMLEQTHLGRQPIVRAEFIKAYDVIRTFILLKQYLELDVIPAKVLKHITTKGFF